MSDRKPMASALEWALDEIDVLSNMLVKWAYPQGMAMVGREDQFDNYRAAVEARRTPPSTAGWLPISTAPKDGTEIWAYTNEGCQRVVHWEAEHPGAPDDPGHDAGWMSDDGITHPSCFYHTKHGPFDPPLRWRPLPDAPPPSQEGASEGEGEDTSGAVAPPFDHSHAARSRIVAHKIHADLPGNWRAQKQRYNSFSLQVELPCINGLSAWFTVATFHEAGDDERLMTDGARQEAGEYAEKFAALVRNSMQTSDTPSEVEGQT